MSIRQERLENKHRITAAAFAFIASLDGGRNECRSRSAADQRAGMRQAFEISSTEEENKLREQIAALKAQASGEGK